MSVETVQPACGEMTGSEGAGRLRRDSEVLECLLCKGVRHKTVFKEFNIAILRCETCRHVFSSFRADPHYDGFWGSEVDDEQCFYWRQARQHMHAEFFERFTAGRSGKLLDQGCGLGFFVRAAGMQAGWDSFGREISPAAVRYAHDRLGQANVQQGPLETANFPERSFDIITMWDVLDHIPQPDAVLRRNYSLLKPGGVCFLRIPNVAIQLPRARLKKFVLGERSTMRYMQARDHPHHYSMTSIRQLLRRNGFEQVDFIHLHPIGGTTAARHPLARGCKALGFGAVRAISAITAGRLNFDNLFVVACKGVSAA